MQALETGKVLFLFQSDHSDNPSGITPSARDCRDNNFQTKKRENRFANTEELTCSWHTAHRQVWIWLKVSGPSLSLCLIIFTLREPYAYKLQFGVKTAILLCLARKSKNKLLNTSVSQRKTQRGGLWELDFHLVPVSLHVSIFRWVTGMSIFL